MRRIQALLITAGLAAAPVGAAAKPNQSDSWATDKIEWSMGKGRLGVTVMSLSPELRTYFGSLDKTGVLVSRVEPGSPAALAGIAVGDVIVNVRGTKIDDAGDVLATLANVNENEKVTVKVLRDRKVMSFDVALTSSATSSLSLPGMSILRQLFDIPRANCT